jgi:hypothetical protein
MAELKLKNGFTALVDDDIYPFVARLHWRSCAPRIAVSTYLFS